jgi:TfoX/Sxy family transcriptional regulator of competence genes
LHFPKSPPELIERFEDLVPPDPDITTRKMFGYPACFINGNMFTGLHGTNMMLRLPENERKDFIAQTGSHIFEPMPGHQMKEYVVVPTELINSAVNSWLNSSITYARSLPPKIKKKA